MNSTNLIRAWKIRIVALLAAVLTSNTAPAQNQNRIPPKDIAILADVSISVRSDWPKHAEAREMIIKLASGEPIDWANSDWEVEPTQDIDLLHLFGRALGRPEGIVPPEPLTAPGHNLLVLLVGKLTTVNGLRSRRQIGRMSDFAEMVRAEYPKEQDIKDGSTCFWYAMARTADLLSDGYYLFVVSDEIDDPDYLEHGPRGHSVSDYRNYRKNLEAQFPLSSIQATINAHFDQNPGQMGRDAYRPRPEFARTLIASFYQKKFKRDDERKVRLSWYAMGAKPTLLPDAPAPASQPEKAVTPPLFRREIALLGGLESPGAKIFHYANPLLVWEVPYAEANGLSGSHFEVQTAQGASLAAVQGSSVTPAFSPRLNGPKTAQLHLEPGKYILQVVEKSEGGAPVVKSKPLTIEIQPTNDWILPLLAAAAALAALGIFIWTWLSLGPRTAGAK
jgi:hypothetical protein